MKKPSKFQRSLLIECPACSSLVGIPCSLTFLTKMDPQRAERHAMKRSHTERYVASVGLVVEQEEES